MNMADRQAENGLYSFPERRAGAVQRSRRVVMGFANDAIPYRTSVLARVVSVKRLLAIGVILAMQPSFAAAQQSDLKPGSRANSIGGYARSPGPPNQTRSVTYAQHGMAATSDLRATQA